MTFDELHEKVRKATGELYDSGLCKYGFNIQIELSLDSYRKICAERESYFYVKTEVDDVREKVHRGYIFNVPFVLTEGTDRVLIAKEPADK